jgi:hypothetical protein
LLSRIWFWISVPIPDENPWKEYTSILRMHVHIIQNTPLNVWAGLRPTGCHIRPYSPDLAPSDFFLFGFMKTRLSEYDIPDRKDLKSAISQIFAEISQDMLISVFEAWIKRLKWVIMHRGGGGGGVISQVTRNWAKMIWHSVRKPEDMNFWTPL